MPSLGDVYVDVHANTKFIKPEIRKAAKTLDDEGRTAGQKFYDGFLSENAKGLRTFNKTFQSEIRNALKAIPTKTPIGFGTKQARADLATLRAEFMSLKDIKVGVDLDTGSAEARLSALMLQLAAFDRRNSFMIKRIGFLRQAFTNLGVSASSLARTFTSGLNAAIDAAGAGAASFAKNLGPVATGLGALIAIAGPAAGALGGVALALAMPIGAGLAGGGIFAFLAGKYIGQTSKVHDQIDKLKDKLEKTTSLKKKFAIQQELQNLEASLTGAQKKFEGARGALSRAFDSFTKANGGALLQPFTHGLEILTKTLGSNALSSMVTNVSKSLDGLLSQLDRSGTINSFLGALSKFSGPAITSIGKVLGGLGGIIKGIFTGGGLATGQAALDGIGASFQRFAKYLQSNPGQAKLQGFFNWIRTQGPVIGHAFAQVGKFIVDAFVVAEPVITQVTRAIGVVASAVGNFIKPFKPILKVIGALASGAITAFGPLLKIIATAAGVVTAFAVAFKLLNLVMNANPISKIILGISLLVKGFQFAWQHSEKFRSAIALIANTATHAFGYVVQGIGWVITKLGDLVHAAGAAIVAIHPSSGLGKALSSAGTTMQNFGASTTTTANKLKNFKLNTDVASDGSNKLKGAANGAAGAVNKLGKSKASPKVTSPKTLASLPAKTQAAERGLKTLHRTSASPKVTSPANVPTATKNVDKLKVAIKGLPASKSITIKMSSLTGYISKAKDLHTAISALRGKSITVTTHYTHTGTPPSGAGGATGGRIAPGFAGGGRVPGMTPSNRSFDNVAAVSRRGNPLRVQSGEWIINSRQSKQNNELLSAINSGFNAQAALGYAHGGRVQSQPAPSPAVSTAPAVVNNNVQQIFTGPTTGARRNRELDWTLRFATTASAAAGGAGGMN